MILNFNSNAQTIEDSFSIQQIEEIVVTGGVTPHSARQSVYQIRSIGQETIKLHGASRLQDVLATETNIRFNQDLATGGSNMSMQGLAGQNVKILIDGVPMIGRQGTNNEININQIDINTIQRVEIVEGPMSVIYGADALAGVINIITKKAVEGKYDLTARIQEETVNNAYGWPAGIHQESMTGGIAKKDLFAKINLSRNEFGGYQGSATGRDFQWHPKTQYMAGTILGVDKIKTSAHYRLDWTNENIFNPGIPTSNIANDQNYITNRWMHQFQLDHNVSTKIKLNTAFSFTHFSRNVESTTFNVTTQDRRLSLGTDSQDTTIFNGFTGRILLPIVINKSISLLPGVDVNIESGRGGRIQAGTHTIKDAGFILSGELKLSDKLQIKPGLRMIYNSVYHAPAAIPSLNTRWNISSKSNIKLSYGRGFRAPSLRELYFSFFDSNHAVVGNTNLKSELSNSFSGSWSWILKNSGPKEVSLSLNGFYNSIDNLINFGQNAANPLEVTYINIDHYKTKGLTGQLQSKAEKLSLNFTASYTGRYNQLYTEDQATNAFVWSPEGSLSINYNFQKNKFSIGLFQKYTGKTPYYETVLVDSKQIIHQAILKDYFWSDLTLNKSINTRLSISTGVRNLFNIKQVANSSLAGNGVHTNANSLAVGYGRSLFLILNYNIIK